ncbi:hypothetical protein ASG90_00875 [Nocardioides sp. Soil797]|nr:hypothetical protein ASG90_00875 [Nocardioides sp. Soil797]
MNDTHNRIRSATLAVLVTLGMAVALAAPVGAAAAPESVTSQAQAAAKKARISVVMKAPKGVPAQVLLRGKSKKIATKKATSTKTKKVLKVRPGRYRIKPSVSTYDGRSYAPKVKRSSVKAKAGRTVRVTVVWKKVAPPAGLEITATTRSSIDLAWSGKGTSFELRRTSGDVAPTQRSQGTRISMGKAKSASDGGLDAGKRYGYSLWTKVVTKRVGKKARTRWVGPVSVTAGTVRTDPATGGDSAEYSLSPHSIVVDAGDKDVVTVKGSKVWVRLAKSRPAPVMGAGMALPASRELTGGFIGTIDEISADGRTVRLKSAGIGDVFDHFEVSGAFESDPVEQDRVEYGTYDPTTEPDAGAATAPDQSSDQLEQSADEAVTKALKETGASKKQPNAKAHDQAAKAPAFPSAQQEAPSKSCLSYNASDLRVGIDPMFDTTGDFDFMWHKKTIGIWKLKLKVPHAASMDLSAGLTMGASFDVAIKKELKCFLGLDDFYRQVITYPVPMGIRYSGGLEIRGYGKLALENFGFDMSTGFNAHARVGTDAGFDADTYRTGNTYDPEVTGEIGMEAALTGQFTFGPAAGTKDVGVIAGVNGQLDLAKVAVAGQFGDPTNGQEKCLDISFGGSADLSLKAEAWAGSLEASKTFDLWSEEWDYVDPFRYPAGCVKDEELGDGDVRATLRWTNGTDYDLHVVDPLGQHVWYSEPVSESGGELDHDIIPGCSEETSDGSYIENTNWQEDTAPVGQYTVYVDEYRGCDLGARTWLLEVYVDGHLVIHETGAGTSEQYTFTVPGPE